jgi:hypothetical protein
VVVISPPGYAHSGAFAEVAETLVHAIAACGRHASAAVNAFAPDAIPIVLGSNLVGESAVADIPRHAVIYNLEQLDANSPWWHAGLRALVERCETWDYSARNVARLAELGVQRPALHVPLGVMPQLRRIAPAAEPDIDVLFYGSMSPRRRAALDAIRARGLRVVELFGKYGAERDAFIARAKLVVNIHNYPAQILETVRLSYLLANGVPVVAECNAATTADAGLVAALRAVPYDGLADACAALAADPSARAWHREAGLRWADNHPMAPVLAPHLARLERLNGTPYAPAAVAAAQAEALACR